ncbi:putative sh3 domain-containing protein [Phaeoacremonium minimum UCRPA7]|uniref:Putative sh3 domain-containing protein n=1 Tax=Phaeoacremonium minimum (strain UCR-PA7) TaxID=1286976 RepID=R8BE83_PHAM7|nr:putative sh3 domain-containing protein [Phaeoacremonium minimum UCRPA7]EON97619.1 putative sh3 domain-containing protein [Phaeoacremonium minimum UCRPA7]
MDEAIGDLVLGPFREIVTQGNTAIENAREAGNEQMLKAAQALVKEGERALKKIEPLCRKTFDEFAANFVNALKDNGAVYLKSELKIIVMPANKSRGDIPI